MAELNYRNEPFQKQLKTFFDPNNILSPGRYAM
jgi:hypothetical protein